MADETRKINVLVQTTNARKSVEQLAQDFDKLGSTVGKSDKELVKHDQALIRMGARARVVSKDLRDLRDELTRQQAATTAQRARIKELEGQLDGWRQRTRLARAEVKALTKENEALRLSNIGLSRAQQQTTASTKAQATAMTATAKAAQSLDSSFRENALRYALYDVGSSFTNLRDVGVRALTDLIRTGTQFERNFANVVRTSQVLEIGDGVTGVRQLRDAFLDLQSSLPVTSEELTRIGTLAAQMGIAAGEVANFVEVTAKFAATSGISADEAATALARISQMLPDDVAGDVERLASAILKTGVNAIATEQQIVRGTTQIAAIGKVAGLSATEIVALSSAMSSLGMSPELQRSIVTSSFTKILTAVRGSTEEAAKFGRVLGLSGKQFQEAWENDAYNTYRKLLAAIAESPEAITILQSLSLSSQRLTPNLLKLGQAYGLLGQTLEDTNKGWEEDTELQRQYQIIMDTTASKLQVLSQAWDAFLVIIGTDAVKALGDLATWLTEALKRYQDFAQTDAGRWITGFIVGLGLVVTALAAIMTAITLAGAGVLGFDFVIKQLNVSLASGTGLLGGMKAGMDRLTASSVTARTAVSLLSVAMRTLGAALLVVGAVTILPDAFRGLRELTNITPDLNDAAKAIQEFNKKQIFTDLGFDKDADNWFAKFGTLAAYKPDEFYSTEGNFAFDVTGINSIIDTTKRYDEALRDMANSGNAQDAAEVFAYIHDQLVSQGADPNTTLEYFPEYLAAIGLNASASAADLEKYQQGLEETASAEEIAALRTATLASALGLASAEYTSAEDAVTGFLSAIKSGAGGFFDFGTMLEDAYGTGDGQGGGLGRLQQDLTDNLAAAETWSAGIQELTIKGASSLAQAFAAQGPASQQAVVDALALSPEALSQLETSMADAAFFASDAYAQAFAEETGVLAQIYKQMLTVNPQDALNAVHDARDAIRNAGGVLDADTLAGLQSKYGFSLDVNLTPTITEEDLETSMALLNAKVTPIKVPVTTTVGQGEFEATREVENWIVSMEGHSIVMPVDPNTTQGREMLNVWRTNEYNSPLALQTYVNTDPATVQLNNWMNLMSQRSITIKTNISGGGLRSDPTQRATGGGIGIPGYARGTLDGPIRGPGTTTSDSILARLSRGEWVHNARAVSYYGHDFMDAVNKMRFPRFATGGSPSYTSPSTSSSGANVNVTVVQNYPTTQDPIKKLKADAESVVAGIWT